MASFVGIDETIPVSLHHDVYPAIDPASAYKAKALKGKVALITGASRGIGQAIALGFAQAGASLALVSRSQATLDKTKAAVLAVAPGTDVLTFPADVRKSDAAAKIVKNVVDHFGHLDLLVPNAGALTPITIALHEKDPAVWWNTFEVNVRGVFNFVHAAITHLVKTNGRILITGSIAAHVRYPNQADYNASKLTIDRFGEFVAAEYPAVKTFVIHPGVVIGTELAQSSLGGLEFPSDIPTDSIELASAFFIHVALGKADWLNGRFWDVEWDIEEVERKWKDKIVAQNGLVNKLFIPQ
ncbi:NAD-P-binding protein [Vararia minispora EC-137]|uniref:NAD-P-binding protein n=1 Tax=Vararia minispora EC-137 TaxID=1314806 RepID=A0ACB8QSH2_9AGAM|nr:NAD-P-binding protein [Vararia minispora EC-137]